MTLYINGYKPTLSKEELEENIQSLYSIISYELDLLKVQYQHDRFSDMVTTAESIKKCAQEGYNIDLNMKDLEK